ncbi:MAG: LysR family transcriptional regulator [Clostridia bacterium]|nr:LysR family transcriptional regulator [Clostridia bacterium]
MDTQSATTFVTIARLGNFTQAAEELHYAQSTVTMQMQRLEKELGFPLFERIGRKTQLTAEGKEFLSYAERFLELSEGARRIGRDAKTMTGTLRVGILESLLFAKMLPILSEFRREFPNLEINLKIGQASELRSLLKQNQLDVIYISGSANTDPALRAQYRREEELVFAVDPAHPLAQKAPLSLSEIFEHPFIVTEPTGYCYGHLLELASEQDCELRHSVVLDSIIAICSLLSDRQSVAFLPRYALSEQVAAGRLSILDICAPKQMYYSQLLCAKDKWISPFIDALIQKIKSEYPEH